MKEYIKEGKMSDYQDPLLSIGNGGRRTDPDIPDEKRQQGIS